MALKKSFSNKAASNTYENVELRNEELDYRGLPKDHRYGFAIQPCWIRNCIHKKEKDGCKGHLRITTPENAFKLNRPIWRRVNRVSRPRARCKIEDVCGILNIVIEFEFRSDPLLAYSVALRLQQQLIRKGFAPQDLPIIISGAGIHIIINIPEIACTKETARRWNKAIENFIKIEIEPLFNEAKKIVIGTTGCQDLKLMKIEGTDIARLLSSSGDWRPFDPILHHDDADSLKNGMLRYVYDNQKLIRNEWLPLRLWIEKYYKEVENNPKELKEVCYHQDDTPEDDEIENEYNIFEIQPMRKALWAKKEESLIDAIKRKITYKNKINMLRGTVKFRKSTKTIDRSKLFYQIVCYLCWFCVKHNLDYRKFIWAARFTINECSANEEGIKYQNGKELDAYVRYCVRKWKAWSKRSGKLTNDQFAEEDESVYMKKEQSTTATTDQQFVFEQFIKENCDMNETNEIRKEEFVLAFNEFCIRECIDVLGDQQITRLLKKKNIQTKRKGRSQERFYVGIKISVKTFCEQNNINK